MVEMRVREEKSIQPTEAGPAAQQLALGALSAIDHNAMARDLHQQARMVSLGGRDARGRPQEGEIEHDESLVLAARCGPDRARGSRVLSRWIYDQSPHASTEPAWRSRWIYSGVIVQHPLQNSLFRLLLIYDIWNCVGLGRKR